MDPTVTFLSGVKIAIFFRIQAKNLTEYVHSAVEHYTAKEHLNILTSRSIFKMQN